MSSGNELGAYLRARRDITRPEDVGMTGAGARRVPGLRREELARLARISGEYYLRLEQGRDQHPSDQVVASIARALRLGPEAAAYLHKLSRPTSRTGVAVPRSERVPEGVRELVLSRSDIPAMVLGRYQDVLVANDLAVALSPAHAPGTNALRAAFLDPGVRALYRDGWDRIAASLVAGLRAVAGPVSQDPRLAALVDDLSAASEEFRRLWARHDVASRVGGSSVLSHPVVGPLALSYEKLAVSGVDGQILVLFHAAPDSPAAAALSRLASHRTESVEPVA